MVLIVGTRLDHFIYLTNHGVAGRAYALTIASIFGAGLTKAIVPTVAVAAAIARIIALIVIISIAPIGIIVDAVARLHVGRPLRAVVPTYGA